ncbi:hypothetical protein BRC64_10850 [Halobacteriales archaeon QH_10_67_22]|nr:MAG: hypothetical protein BRC64_10850 [Halobacteriales archaeon QH_10_67_22]
MTDDDDDGATWPPMMSGWQQASEQAIERQQQFLKQMFEAGAGGLDMNQLGAMSQTATFKTRVQSGGRISIPDAEREALDIEEGDIVQTVVIPVKRNRE